MTKFESSFIKVLIIGSVGIIAPVFIEPFFHPAPAGRAGWAMYSTIMIAQIWTLASYKLGWDLWQKRRDKKIIPPHFAMMKGIILLTPVCIIGKYNIEEFPVELIGFVFVSILMSCYFLFIRWKISKQ